LIFEEEIMRVKKTALIVCQNGKEFWVTQKKFWNMVREGMVIQTGDYPLTGKFRGREEHLLVMIQHTILNQATPVHTSEVLHARRISRIKR
jgi:hypothetical protein